MRYQTSDRLPAEAAVPAPVLGGQRSPEPGEPSGVGQRGDQEHRESEIHETELEDVGAHHRAKAGDPDIDGRECGPDGDRQPGRPAGELGQQGREHQQVGDGDGQGEDRRRAGEPRALDRTRSRRRSGMDAAPLARSRGASQKAKIKRGRIVRGDRRRPRWRCRYRQAYSPTPRMPPYQVVTRVATKAGRVSLRPARR